MTQRNILALGVLLILAPLAWAQEAPEATPSQAGADVSAQALAVYEQGKRLYDAKDDAGALEQFDQAASGHKVSLLTNLSAPLRVLSTFIEAAGEQLRTFSCSLHREMLARWPRATFVVNSVVVPGQVPAVSGSRERFEEAGNPLKGRLCHAGSKDFIIHPKGDAFSCYPGKRFGDGHLGNVFDGTLKLWEAPRPCRYEVCPCTVPQNRGIIEGFGKAAGDEAHAF